MVLSHLIVRMDSHSSFRMCDIKVYSFESRVAAHFGGQTMLFRSFLRIYIYIYIYLFIEKKMLECIGVDQPFTVAERFLFCSRQTLT